MGIEKLTKKRKSIFGRLTNKFLAQSQHLPKRDQSVQTSLNVSQTSSQLTATVLVNSRLRQRTCSPSDSVHNNSIHTPHHRRSRRRSSIKTFIISHSPKPIPLINRTRRRSVDLKTPKRLSSECLQVALIRKIQPVTRYGSPLASNIISVSRQKQYYSSPKESFDYPTMSHYSYLKHSQQLFQDEPTRDEMFSIGPMKWSTPNRTLIYKTSSPYNSTHHQNFDCHRRLCAVEQLSFSNILDGSN